MGYSFSIKNANAVGHLIDGNIITFLNDSLKSPESLIPNIEFIDELLENPEADFYTTEAFWKQISPGIGWLRTQWQDVKKRLKSIDNSYLPESIYNERSILDFFRRLSDLLSRCKIKTLLLPGFSDAPLNNSMRSRSFLRLLVDIHPGNSVLILQIKEHLNLTNISILNSFPKFEIAYDQIDRWPGILLWNDKESIFVNVESEREVVDIFELLKYEKNSFNFLRELVRKKQPEKNAYFFHLSDLHFGNAESNRRKLRLTTILESHLSNLSDKSTAIPVITGDLMDTPNKTNKNTYLEFCELIKGKGFENPIHLLGNHDVDSGGFFKRLTNQKFVISSLSGVRNVDVLQDLDLAFVKFNSNAGGKFAQGKIGADQLMTIGNEIDQIPNKKRLNFIALLHHHPKEIENPDWYARDWYEALLGNSAFEKTMKLDDSELFLQWIESRNIKLILHGHKHIPKIHKHNDVTIVAAGSSTGKVKHKEAGKTFLTYNLIKYDIYNKQPVSCTVIAEDILGSGTKNIMLHLL